MSLVHDIFTHRIPLPGGGHLDAILPRRQVKYAAEKDLTLYHYSPHGGDEMDVDPGRFGTNPHTQREAKTSPVPRSFWYVDLADKEPLFRNTPLYQSQIPSSQVYDLEADPMGLKTGDADEILRKIKAKGFRGVKYDNGSKIVSLFDPLRARRVDEDKTAKERYGKTVPELQASRQAARDQDLSKQAEHDREAMEETVALQAKIAAEILARRRKKAS